MALGRNMGNMDAASLSDSGRDIYEGHVLRAREWASQRGKLIFLTKRVSEGDLER